MQFNPKVKRRLKFQNLAFVILFVSVLGLLAWLSTRYEYVADWTANQRNTVSEATKQVLGALDEPIKITAFVSESNAPAREEIRRLVNIYQRYKNNIELTFVDPVTEPGLVRDQGIGTDGEMVIEYGERSKHLLTPTEQDLTNILQQLGRAGDRWIGFVGGHSERRVDSGNELDYTLLSQQLEKKGFNTRVINLAVDGEIPDDLSLLVIADPRSNFLPGEVQLVLDYVNEGGNLLWLLEPDIQQNLDVLAEEIGLELLPGTLVDPNTQLLGLSDPLFALVAEYPMHPITNGFNTLTVFPVARGMEHNGDAQWDVSNILQTLPRSWLETDELMGELAMDPGQDIQGPITIGVALNRLVVGSQFDEMDAELEDNIAEGNELDEGTPQRIVVVGDADFLSNSYLGQGGNLDLGLNIINWLSNDDEFINIPAKAAFDTSIELSSGQQATIGFTFMLVIPLILLICGIVIWLKRRKA